MNAAVARSNLLQLHYPRRHHYHPVTYYRHSLRFFASPSSHSPHAHYRPLPIAAFVDLDNVAPQTIRRSDARNFVRPLLEFERRVNYHARCSDNNNASKQNWLRVEAFGNTNNSTTEKQQSNIFKLGLDLGEDDGQEEVTQTVNVNDGESTIHCPVCECHIKLSKNDKKNKPNYTLLSKYKTHLKMHSMEQRKRRSKMQLQRYKNKKKSKKYPLLGKKEMEKFRRYEAAMSGLKLLEQQLKLLGTSSRPVMKPIVREECFQVLREFGVRVHARTYVNKALISAADRWMHKNSPNDTNNDTTYYEQQKKKKNGSGSSSVGEYNGVLVIYSKDMDIIPLLTRAKERGFLVVSATNEVQQTSDLLQCSDVVLGPFGKWMDETKIIRTTPLTTTTTQSTTTSSFDSDDENENNEDYVIRKVSRAPLFLLSAPVVAHDSAAVQAAIPISDDGVHFMSERHNSGGDENNVRWDLTGGSSETSVIPRDDGTLETGLERGLTMGTKVMEVMAGMLKRIFTFPSNESSALQKEAEEKKEPAQQKEEEEKDREYVSNGVIKGTRRRKIYRCDVCSHQTKKWSNFKRHQHKTCTSCTPEIRDMRLKDFIVYLDDDEDDANSLDEPKQNRQMMKRSTSFRKSSFGGYVPKMYWRKDNNRGTTTSAAPLTHSGDQEDEKKKPRTETQTNQ